MAVTTRDIDDLKRRFHQAYGSRAPTHMVQAPGRVNLIGEHIDYNGLPVLPMAIDRRILLLLRARTDNVIRVTNADPRFYRAEFTLRHDIPASPGSSWVNYLKAGAQAVVRAHRAEVGFDAVIGSSLPVAAGLSSSSALVVATALALDHVNAVDSDPLALAALLAEGERYVGTQGGGMDQAICLAARAGTASRITFGPLRVTPRRIPRHWRFVVAHSLADAEKSGAIQETYNQRTQECEAALATIAQALNRPMPTYMSLLETEDYGALRDAAGTLDERFAKRFRHVVSEARRVFRAECAMEADDLAAFGNMLVASHLSLRDDFEVSTPDLDLLAEIALDGGAAGARLTGAGMGGCAIAVTDADHVASVVEALAERFYRRRGVRDPEAMHLFTAEPSHGASVSAM